MCRLTGVDANKDGLKAAALSRNIHPMTGIGAPDLQVGMPRGEGRQKAVESWPPSGVRLSLSPRAVHGVQVTRDPSRHDVQIKLPSGHSVSDGLEVCSGHRRGLTVHRDLRATNYGEDLADG